MLRETKCFCAAITHWDDDRNLMLGTPGFLKTYSHGADEALRASKLYQKMRCEFPATLHSSLSTGVPDSITPPTTAAASAARNKSVKHKQVSVFLCESRSCKVHERPKRCIISWGEMFQSRSFLTQTLYYLHWCNNVKRKTTPGQKGT